MVARSDGMLGGCSFSSSTWRAFLCAVGRSVGRSYLDFLTLEFSNLYAVRLSVGRSIERSELASLSLELPNLVSFAICCSISSPDAICNTVNDS